MNLGNKLYISLDFIRIGNVFTPTISPNGSIYYSFMLSSPKFSLLLLGGDLLSSSRCLQLEDVLVN